MKNILLNLLLLLFIISCKNEKSTNVEINNTSEIFAELLQNFNEEGLVLNPLNATQAGDNRFNDQLPNFLSEDYKAKKKAYYTKYKNLLSEIDESQLSETEKMSKAVLLWDCEINLEEMTFQKRLNANRSDVVFKS